MIRLAEKKDIDTILLLLGEVLSIHANGRPDVFKSGVTKYNRKQVEELISKKDAPVYVYECDGVVVGYAFCVLREQEETNVLKAYKYLYIDDLCVSTTKRGQGIGRALYNHVKEEAKRFNCTRVTLNVWHLNSSALGFYMSLGLNPLKTTMEEIL